ncbi:hypothetical protein EVAR_3466_1 [Eumeta japonica]|uniref:Uncharacterized protein n=1 Tax=Eumeta variegata TaxID=151549 RepID=A0A4C1SSE2_EUMVA|nr:hypothetical protein EVAR_3466_1 [Eumeta japonica]
MIVSEPDRALYFDCSPPFYSNACSNANFGPSLGNSATLTVTATATLEAKLGQFGLQNVIVEKIKARLTAGNKSFHACKAMPKNKFVTTNSNLMIYKTNHPAASDLRMTNLHTDAKRVPIPNNPTEKKNVYSEFRSYCQLGRLGRLWFIETTNWLADASLLHLADKFMFHLP